MSTAESAPPVNRGWFASFIEKFTVLFTAPRELWLIYLAKIMEIAAYGLVSMSLMLFLTGDVDLGEVTAGSMIAGWSISISFFTLLAGGLTDAIGIKKTFLIGYGFCLFSRGVAVAFDHPIVVIIASLAPMSLGLALMVPVMTAAVRRYTNTKQRSIAFSMYYVLMNVGFLISGWLFDQMRNADRLRHGFETHLPDLGGLGIDFLSIYQLIFLVSVGFTVLGVLPILLFMRRGVEMDEHEDTFTIDPSRETSEEGGFFSTIWGAAVKTAKIFLEVMSESAFYRFILLVALVIGVKMVFYHMHYTLPLYADRELGYGSRFGMAWGFLNPAIIIVLVPLVGALAQKVSSYKMLVIGTFFSSLPVFLLVLPNDFFMFLVDTPLGTAMKIFLDIDGDLSPLYVNLIIFVSIFSVGEAIWSPRLYEYTASVAPVGREGTYMGMSVLPYFLAKFAVGPLAGVLIASYCPAEGIRTSNDIWWIVAGMAVATPVLLIALKPFITKGTQADETINQGKPADEQPSDAEEVPA